jgi:protein tyrosine/serine phosphatase
VRPVRTKAGPGAGRPAAARILAALFLSFLTSLAAVAQAPQAKAPQLKNFGRVNENYFRGSQPVGADFAELKRFGIRTIVDLRRDRLGESEELARAQGLAYFHIPMTTQKPATDEQTAYFLSLVNDPANWPVYVHCKGGRHRTGQMTAIYRITQEGWTAEQAYDEMKRYDFEDGWFYPRAVKQHVFEFHRKFAARRTAATGAREM